MPQIFPELSPCLPHTPWARSFFPLPFPSAVTVGSGCVGQILLLSFTFPSGVPPDLESGVKKCPNLFRLCGFAIRSKGVCLSFCWGIANPPVLIGRTFFYGGFQIRRDAWRGCALGYYSVITLPSLSRTVHLPICQLVGR